jgi:alkylated DNA repair dioxygenase AlkB
MKYLPGYLAPSESSGLFRWLSDTIVWEQEAIHLFGRERLVPRRVAWFGDDGLDYRYSGRSHPARRWPPLLSSLRERVAQELGEIPNFVLLNQYRTGSDSMGWHRDDEASTTPRIASLSLGASRSFLVREADAPKSRRLVLDDGSLLVFDGTVRHALPKTRRRVGERINLTFRVLR